MTTFQHGDAMDQHDSTSPCLRHRSWDIGRHVTGYAWDAPHPRAVMLLQHGFGEYAERYVPEYSALIPNLLKIGLSVYAFDLRGHGHSPGKRAVTDVDTAVADHLAARRELEAQPLPIFLMGHSLGGIVTATSVVRYPGNVRGVILSSPALLVKANVLTRLFARVVATIAPALPVKNLPACGVSRRPDHLRSMAADPLLYRGGMPAKLAASVLFTSQRNWGRYPCWNVPTLAVHGTADTLTEPEGSRQFITTISSDDKTLHLVKGGYHELLNDIGSEDTLRLILTWLDKRAAMPGQDADETKPGVSGVVPSRL